MWLGSSVTLLSLAVFQTFRIYMCLTCSTVDVSVRHKNPLEIEAFCTEHLNFQKLGWHRNRVLRNLNTERFRCQYLSLPRRRAKQQDHPEGVTYGSLARQRPENARTWDKAHRNRKVAEVRDLSICAGGKLTLARAHKHANSRDLFELW